jgi:hypothetical protein
MSRPADLLLLRQNVDGGWGAAAGGVSNSECTALACLALRSFSPASATNYAPELTVAYHWLLDHQDEAGAWPWIPGVPGALWPTPIVVLSLLSYPTGAGALSRGLDWLLSTKGEQTRVARSLA